MDDGLEGELPGRPSFQGVSGGRAFAWRGTIRCFGKLLTVELGEEEGSQGSLGIFLEEGEEEEKKEKEGDRTWSFYKGSILIFLSGGFGG